LRDTREQKPWDFPEDDNCEGTIATTLKTGDYSLQGLEDKLIIERKGCVSEWANNVVDERFIRELDRLQHFKYRYILLEFSLRDMLLFPLGSGIPQFKQGGIKVRGDLMLRKTTEFQLNYNVNIWFCDSSLYAKQVATSIFKRVISRESSSTT